MPLQWRAFLNMTVGPALTATAHIRMAWRGPILPMESATGRRFVARSSGADHAAASTRLSGS